MGDQKQHSPRAPLSPQVFHTVTALQASRPLLLRVLDHFDEAKMSEACLARAIKTHGLVSDAVMGTTWFYLVWSAGERALPFLALSSMCWFSLTMPRRSQLAAEAARRTPLLLTKRVP